MEPTQDPITQAPPPTATVSTIASPSQPTTATTQSTIASPTRQLITQADPLAPPIHSHLGPTLPTPSASSSSVLLETATSAAAEPAPLPASLIGRPEPTTLFGRAQWNSTIANKGAVPYTEPDEYVDPPPATGVPSPTGQVGAPPRARVVTDEEKSKLVSEERLRLEALKEKENIVDEAELKTLTADQLRKMGFGRNKSGFCFSTRMTLHHPLPGLDEHPEKPARITGVFDRLKEAGLADRMQRVAVRQVTRDEVLLVHSEAHWQQVYATGFQSNEYLMTCAEYFERLSLYINPHSSFAARLSCGGVIEMARAVAEGSIRNGFAIVRPPGHHAEPQEAMGFCLFNNVAVAAKWLLTMYGNSESKTVNGDTIKMKKILIIDWDIHHGNGTQAAFYDDPNVLYLSLHKHGNGFYPGGDYGGVDKVGDGAGEGYSVNIPFPWDGSGTIGGKTSMGDADYLYAFQQIVMPIAYEFAPDMVIVSAGYDAAEGDHLGLYKVTPAGYAHMTHMLSVLANGKLLLALEGGYAVESVAKSAHACVEVLVGDEPRALQIGGASTNAVIAVESVKLTHAKYWKSMGQALESVDELKLAGEVVPISEILKAHRTYELYTAYSLYNIEFPQSSFDLETAFKDQLLVSDDVYSCDTLVVFLHDLGSLKAMVDRATLDLNLEKTFLVDTSHQILDWATHDLKAGIIDMNFLAHQKPPKDQQQVEDALQVKENLALRKKLALHIWDNLANVATANNIILIGLGSGCQGIIDIISERQGAKDKVKACIAVHGMEQIPELPAASQMRGWFKEHSLVLAPASHPIHEEVRKAGLKSKKYGAVVKPSEYEEIRPLHMLKACMSTIRSYVAGVLPTEEYVDEHEDDVVMGEAPAQE